MRCGTGRKVRPAPITFTSSAVLYGTVTDCVIDDVRPEASVTLRVTLYVPGTQVFLAVGYQWLSLRPFPQSQPYDTMPWSSVEVLPFIAHWCASPVLQLHVKFATGG